jgi:hypothetical protein
MGTRCVGLLLLLPLAARAQPPAPEDAPRVAPGTQVRVTHENAQQTGTLRGTTYGYLQLQRPDGAALGLELARVERLEVARHYAVEGALIGGGVGALGLATGFALACHADGNRADRGDDIMVNLVPACATGGLLLGGLAGMGIGALVGWAVPGWRTAWQRPPVPAK